MSSSDEASGVNAPGEVLSGARLTTALGPRTEWALLPSEAAIGRRLEFATFREAFDFMTRIAILGEEQGHHPDWSQTGGKIEIRLTTHDAGGVTTSDLQLANAIDAMLATVQRSRR